MKNSKIVYISQKEKIKGKQTKQNDKQTNNLDKDMDQLSLTTAHHTQSANICTIPQTHQIGI